MLGTACSGLSFCYHACYGRTCHWQLLSLAFLPLSIITITKKAPTLVLFWLLVEMTGVEPVSKRGLTVLSSCEVQILNFSRCRLLHRLHFDEVLIYLSAPHHWQKDLPILNDAALLSDRTTGATGSLITQRKPIDYYFLRLI